MEQEIDTDVGMFGKDAIRDRHPAFGMISFLRIQTGGKRRLFGSALEMHPTSILMRVKHASREHHMGRDWFFADKGIVEVELSAAQFAELITSMNMGDGVPCTLRYVEGKEMPSIPVDDKMEKERVVDQFKANMEHLLTDLRKKKVEVDRILEKKGALTKDERSKIDSVMQQTISFVNDRAPFMMDQFSEAADRLVVSAKMEAEAFVRKRIESLGMQSIAQLQDDHVRALPVGFMGIGEDDHE